MKDKGIRRKFLPEPNPTRVEFTKGSSILSVFEKSVNLFYKDFPRITANDVMLANSSGNRIEVDPSCKLRDYYLQNQYVPSKHKLYTMVDLSMVRGSLCECFNVCILIRKRMMVQKPETLQQVCLFNVASWYMYKCAWYWLSW